MKFPGRMALCVALAITASACGEEPANNQATAAENVQPAANEAMAGDPDNPFAQVEMQMHDRMMAASGATPSETWIRKMIEHHQGAVEMSNLLIGQGGDSEAVAEARRTVEMQTREIERLRALLEADAAAPAAAGSEPAPSAPRTPPAAAPRPAPKAEAPRPRPTPPAKEEPADPHAGHDMGNMANMSRD